MSLVVNRRPKVGDVVRAKASGHAYRVTDIHRTGPSRFAPIDHVVVERIGKRLGNTFRPAEVEVLSTLVNVDLVLRELAGDRCTNAKAVARALWPDSPGWHRSSNVGYGSTTGVGPPRAAGVEINRLVKLGVAKPCGPYDHSDGWRCYGYRPVGLPLLERKS